MIQIGIKSIFIIIGYIIMRLIFPFEFTFSDSFASRYFMPDILNVLHTPVISALNKIFTILHIVFFAWVVGIIITAASTIKARLYFGQVVKQLPILYDSKINKILHKRELANAAVTLKNANSRVVLLAIGVLGVIIDVFNCL